MNYEEKTIKCTHCDKVIENTAAFCPYCGHPVQKAAPKTCRSCGASLEPDAKFCPQCAAPVDPANGVLSQALKLKKLEPGTLSWWPAADRLQALCGSAACLTLTIALTVLLVCRVLFQFSVSGLISSIPNILICIGCWMCFWGGRKNELTPSGFRLISGTLTFLAITGCLGSALGCLLSIVLISSGVVIETFGLFLLIVFGVCLFLTWTYWTQLRLSARSAGQIVQNGKGRVTASMFSIVLLYISAAGNLITLANAASAMEAFYGLANTLGDYIYYYLPYEFQNVAYNLLYMLEPRGGTSITVLGNLAAVIVPLCAGLILQRLRKEQRNWVC